MIARIHNRLESGYEGNVKQLTNADGIYEIRFKFGAGYRIYYGEHDKNRVVLLCAGDKSTQTRDIKKAKRYWKEYLKND